jgi:tRNA threonylcarbamoyladenosine biosynthesis protein TsaB
VKLLLLNTCGAEGVAALAEDGSVLCAEMLPGRGASEHLLPALRRLFAEQDWRVAELSAAAVVVGPGSFTGVRAGLSAAKGLCEAAAVAMVAISRLALVAEAFPAAGKTLALLDAGRSEYYGGVHYQGAKLIEELMPRDQVEELLKSHAGITSDAKVAAAFVGAVRLVEEPGPGAILDHALRRIAAGELSDVALTDALYLRRTDAELLARQAEHAQRAERPRGL